MQLSKQHQKWSLIATKSSDQSQESVDKRFHQYEHLPSTFQVHFPVHMLDTIRQKMCKL